jgi:hypothetical protein
MKRGIIKEPLRDRRGWRIFDEEAVEKIRQEATKTSSYL